MHITYACVYVYYIHVRILHTHMYITYAYVHYIRVCTLHTRIYITYAYVYLNTRLSLLARWWHKILYNVASFVFGHELRVH